jgi:hypothetical protein
MSDELPCPYCGGPMHPVSAAKYGACCDDHGEIIAAREELTAARARIAELEKAQELWGIEREALRQNNQSQYEALLKRREEIAELRARVGTWHDCKAQADAVDRANERERVARADAARLREALMMIAHPPEEHADQTTAGCRAIAAAALTDTGTDAPEAS